MGHTSISRLSQLSILSKNKSLSSFYFTSITVSLEAYLARKIRFTKTIEVLQLKKYIIVVKYAIAFNI